MDTNLVTVGGGTMITFEYVGRRITSAELINNAVNIRFEDGNHIRIIDDGQSCCEDRYITTDDDLESLVGGAITAIVAREAPNVVTEDEWGEHEVMFVEIATSTGFVTLTTHNEHNGYYGGFDLTIQENPEN